MCEGNTLTAEKDENVKIDLPIYSSEFPVNKASYYDSSSVNYRKMKIASFVSMCMIALLVIPNISADINDVCLYALLLSFVMLVPYFRISRAIQLEYERTMFSVGKEYTIVQNLFEDKITLVIDAQEKAFFYHQITDLYETKNFLLLVLPHRLHLSISKPNLNADVDEVKTFLLKRCVNAKKKKFVDCSNDQRLSVAFLIAAIVISVVGNIACLVLLELSYGF